MKMKMPHVPGMTALCLVAFVFVCSTSALFAAPASDQKLVADVQRDLLEGGPLAPLAPRHRPTAASAADLDAIVHEFASTQGKRQGGGGGVPSSLTPVVIVPSLIGSKLQAQLNGYRSQHWYCFTEWREWFTIWANWNEFIPPFANCWYEQFALHLDQQRSGRSFNTPGVDIRYVDYGGVDGVAYLDDEHSVGIWNTTIYLLEALGWEVGKNLRGAPYDWRFGPETFAAQDWPRLRALIEETYTLNNNSKVAAVSLSMGGPYFLAFLNQQTQAWKDKYLHSFVSFDGAFGGSPSATSALISTSGFWSSKFADAEAMRALVQSWPAIVWMLPLAQIYGDDYVWVSTTNPPRNYTTADFAQMLADSTGYNASIVFRNLQASNWLQFTAPGVESHCFFGTGVPTPLRSTFATTAFDTVPVQVYGDGDGVVPEAGLRLLESWTGKQPQPIYSYPIPGLFHGSSVFNKQVLRMFLEILASHP